MESEEEVRRDTHMAKATEPDEDTSGQSQTEEEQINGESTMGSKEEEYKELVRRMAEETNDNNIEALDEFMAPDYIMQQAVRGEFTREEYKEHLRTHREEHDDFTQTVKDVFVNVDDGEILERTQLSGTLTEEEVAESGWFDERQFSVNMNRHHRVEDGRIVETQAVLVPTDTPDE